MVDIVTTTVLSHPVREDAIIKRVPCRAIQFTDFSDYLNCENIVQYYKNNEHTIWLINFYNFL